MSDIETIATYGRCRVDFIITDISASTKGMMYELKYFVDGNFIVKRLFNVSVGEDGKVWYLRAATENTLGEYIDVTEKPPNFVSNSEIAIFNDKVVKTVNDLSIDFSENPPVPNEPTEANNYLEEIEIALHNSTLQPDDNNIPLLVLE